MFYVKVGNKKGSTSLKITIPKTYTRSLGIEKGDYLKVKQDGEKIIIEKVERGEDNEV
jgi:AbrB family looped-hinge helix DNA binding protein